MSKFGELIDQEINKVQQKEPTGELPRLFDLNKSMGTQTTTPQFTETNITPLSIAKSVGQGTARQYLAAGQFISERLKGTPVKEAMAVPFIPEPTSSPFGRFIQALTGTEKPISLKEEDIGLFGERLGGKLEGKATAILTALDFTGLGGAKNVYKALSKTDDILETSKIARQIGVPDDLILPFAQKAVKITDEKEMKQAVEQLEQTMRTTKSGLNKPFSIEEQAKYNNYTHYPKDFNKEYDNIINPIIKKVENIFGKDVPDEIRNLLDEHAVKTEQYLRAEGERMLKAPSPSVVGTANYNVSKTQKANRAFEKKAEGFFEFERKLESKINLLAKEKSRAEFSALSEVDKLKENIASVERQITRMNPTRDEFFIEKMTKQKVLLEKKLSQLTDFYNQAVKEVKPTTIEIKPSRFERLNKEIKYKNLDEIAEAVKGKNLTKERIDDIRFSLAYLEDDINLSPAKDLMKYVSKSTGRLPEVTGKSTMKSLTGSGKIVETSEFGRRGDNIVTELGFEDVFEAEEALERFLAKKKEIKELKEELRPLREKKSLALKGEKLLTLARGERRGAFNALKEVYNLNDIDVAKIRKGRDLSLMSKEDFADFMRRAETQAETISTHREALINLQATIHYKELKNWENVRDALKLPTNFSKMKVEEINKLEEILSEYKTGDEFLPVRMMQTFDNTRLKGLRTDREILEVLAKDKEMTIENVSKIKIGEFIRFKGDYNLARQNPFFERMVFMKNKGLLEANARVIELSDEVDKFIKAARASRPKTILERFIPTDKRIVQWLEANNTERLKLAKDMTVEELKAGQFMDNVFRDYYEYLVKRNAEKKFSRFEDKYFPHIRRDFLEAWKDDGIIAAFKETKNKFAQDEKYFDILNNQTKEILPYEKWIGFTQFRTGNLIPTTNAAKAFEGYITSLEKARQLDAFIPEIMAYVHALTPKNLSKTGLELDTKLKQFVKEWINANKGRTPEWVFKPGGKMDFAVRMSTALTRIIDLGLNFGVQFASPIGEQMMNLTMLKGAAYKTAIARRASKQGQMIIKKYENFTGRSLFNELSRASNTIGNTLMSGIFALFHGATRKGNEIFLLGKMTEEEFKTGIISSERLAKLMTEMNKYRQVKGTGSILGRTAIGQAATQYKGWAIPMARQTILNIYEMRKLLTKEKIEPEVFKELFYSIGIGSIISLATYGYYNNLAEDKDRSFFEDVQYKAMRDAVSIFGAFSPTQWSPIRLAGFYEDLAKAMEDLIQLEKYKTTGKLKGIKELERIFTPRAIKQFMPKEKKEKGELLPKLPKIGTPALPKLPKISSF